VSNPLSVEHRDQQRGPRHRPDHGADLVCCISLFYGAHDSLTGTPT
jgi:hypothetical protein